MELHDQPNLDLVQGTDLPEPPHCGLEELPPPDVFDPVIEAYKKDVDRTLLIDEVLMPDYSRFCPADQAFAVS